jgi:hypothetical protein
MVVGPADGVPGNRHGIMHKAIATPQHETLSEQFQKFTAVETVGVEYRNPDQQYNAAKMLEKMKATVKHDGERFQVSMPFKEMAEDPPESASQAMSRLHSLEKQLAKNPVVAEQYQKRLKEDLEKGYVRKLTPEEREELMRGTHYFLPHFAVYHPDKPGKVRRVLDSKAKNGSGSQRMSLNDMLHTGPDLLNPIFSVLVNFRAGKIAVNADISEMFPQVKVAEEDQKMLAFFFKNEEGEIDVYVNQRHVFGATCSPAVANMCPQMTADDCEDEQVKQLVKKTFYCDDYYGSFDDAEEACSSSSKVKSTVKKGGFELEKFISNCPEALESIEEKDLSPAVKELKNFIIDGTSAAKSKALGVVWNLGEDCFQL